MIDEVWKKLTKEEIEKVKFIMEEEISVMVLQYIEHYVTNCKTQHGRPVADLDVCDYGEVIEQEYMCHLCNSKVIAHDMDSAYLHIINNHLNEDDK